MVLKNKHERTVDRLKFTVVIPTLNEGGRLLSCIQRVRQLNTAAQIVVADGGSTDDTVHSAVQQNAIVCRSKSGRGTQCNAGATVATGEILVFLHADTLLPMDAFELLNRYFRDEQVQIGTFRLGFDEDRWLLKCYGFFTRFDSIFTRFGDSCIVVRKSFFTAIGGFPDWPLFEDVRLLQVARKETRVHSFPAQVITSARKFIQYGLVRQQLRNGALMIRYLLGTAPEKLALLYDRKHEEEEPKRRLFSPYPLSLSFLEETQ